MNRNIYALLVGIDEYVSPVSPLQGCVNDITAIKEYLEGRVHTDGYQLYVRTLLNKNATRQAVIDGFRQHLCQAGSEDVAFFYYAGHGCQEEALPPKGVLITGEEAGVKLARAALLAMGAENQPSLYLQEVAKTENAEFKLLARNGQYFMTRPADDRPIVAQIQGYTEENALQAIERLEHITRWTNIAELSSPATSSIQSDAVQMVIYQEGREVKDATISLQYQKQNGKWKSPTFKVKLKNTSNQELFCALLDLTDCYAVSLELLETGGVWLKPGEEAWALGGENIYPTVPEKLWKQGITESQDILKLIVSTAEFDATLLRQNELDLPFFPEREPGRGRGTLNRLMKRVQSRDLRTAPEEKELYDDWITSQINITTVRPKT